MIPEPVTPAASDFGIRAQSLYDLEVTLQRFLFRLFTAYRLDNPTLNLGQATQPAHPVQPPDPALIPFDYTERAQTLALKVPPRIERGRVPRTVTGEIAVDRLPDCPAIIVQAVSAKVETQSTIVTLRILVNAYDENPESGGYQDVLNMVEAIAIALTSFGQAALDKAYPIIMPIEWKLVEADTFPHYIAEMTTQWELPSGRPMPDPETFGIVPGEHLDIRGAYDYAGMEPPTWVPPPPYKPPPAPPEPVLVDTWAEVNDDGSYGLQGTGANAMTAAYQALTLAAPITLDSFDAYLKPVGAPAAVQIVVRVYAAGGVIGSTGVPTGPVLAESDPIAGATVIEGGPGFYKFGFTGAQQVALPAGNYCFAIELAGGATSYADKVMVGFFFEFSGGPNHAGNGGYNQGGWGNDDMADMGFALYAVPQT